MYKSGVKCLPQSLTLRDQGRRRLIAPQRTVANEDLAGKVPWSPLRGQGKGGRHQEGIKKVSYAQNAEVLHDRGPKSEILDNHEPCQESLHPSLGFVCTWIIRRYLSLVERHLVKGYHFRLFDQFVAERQQEEEGLNTRCELSVDGCSGITPDAHQGNIGGEEEGHRVRQLWLLPVRSRHLAIDHDIGNSPPIVHEDSPACIVLLLPVPEATSVDYWTYHPFMKSTSMQSEKAYQASWNIEQLTLHH